MTKNEIILMADASGLSYYGMGKDRDKFLHYLEAFAKLVAERERETCAKLAKEHAAEYKVGGSLYLKLGMNNSNHAATASNHIAHLISESGFADGKQAAQRKPLTNKEIWQIATDCTIGGDLHADKFARAIEAAHNIKEQP